MIGLTDQSYYSICQFMVRLFILTVGNTIDYNVKLYLLIQMAQWDTVINKTEVTSSHCDRLAQMALSDNLSKFVRPFRTTRYV